MSHSATRPFDRDNPPDGWHAFAFPGGDVAYVPNAQILGAFAEGRFTTGGERHAQTRHPVDTYADIDPDAITPQPLPLCPSPTAAPSPRSERGR